MLDTAPAHLMRDRLRLRDVLVIGGASLTAAVLVALASGWPDGTAPTSLVRLIVGLVLALACAALAVLAQHTSRRGAFESVQAALRQEAVIAQLSQRALAAPNPLELVDEATALVARALAVEDCRVLMRRETAGRAVGCRRAGVADRPAQPDAIAAAAGGKVSTASALIGAADQSYGSLRVATSAPRVFEAAELRFLQRTAAVLAMIFDHSRALAERQARLARLEYQAFHDPLTGLPNRALLADRLRNALARAQRERASVSMLLLDLDDFKAINDSLGHAAGDEVLVETAERIRRCLRQCDTAARLGGDEFAIVLETASESESAEVAARIEAELRSPLVLQQGREIRLSASVGVVSTTATEGLDADAIVARADEAMYRAKQGRRQRTGEAPPTTPALSLTANARPTPADSSRILRFPAPKP
jgi:diguanylate cyclase (GGDEF)-like protein